MAKVTRKGGNTKSLLAAIIAGAKNQHIKVGFWDNATHVNGTPLAYIAVIQEYGCPQRHIPPRPFFRPTVAAQGGRWQQMAKALGWEVLHGNITTAQALEQLGLSAAGDVAETITQVTSPPLAPATILKRLRGGTKIGSADKPLVDTGLLLSSLTSSPVYDGKGTE